MDSNDSGDAPMEVIYSIKQSDLMDIRRLLYKVANPTVAYRPDPLAMANVAIAQCHAYAEEILQLLPEV